ncbi:MAG TPA: ABC transporter permease [Candidatus Mediterraneibacter norfolkensis]|nr:ABC transporter permease [Candidatus Mediterraneibacter norfolkensis]
MGKLIKYEWKKQRTSRMVMLVGLAVCLLAYIWGLVFVNDSVAALALFLMLCGSFLLLLYTGVESILVLNRDLKTKQSYMLWMVPKSIWEIFGAKFLAAILQMLFVFALFFGAGCISLVSALYAAGGIRQIAEACTKMFQFIISGTTDYNMGWIVLNLVWFAFSFFAAWTEVIMIGFLAVVLSRTLLIRSRFAGFFAVILFFIINWIAERGSYLVAKIPGLEVAPIGMNVWEIFYYLIFCAVVFAVTCVLADRKLSV